MKIVEVSGHDGDAYFAGPRVQEAWAEARNPRSRYTICYLSPSDFISVAESGFDADKWANVQTFIQQGKPFPTLPFIGFDQTGRVISHEGRHRTRALHQLGISSMPVVLRSSVIRWGENQADLPRMLLPQTIRGRAIPMPSSEVFPRMTESLAEHAVPVRPEQINPHQMIELPILYRGVEGGTDVVQALRFTHGDLGGGIYFTPNQSIAASYGGGPSASVAGGTRVVHTYRAKRKLYPEEVTYVFGGSRHGEDVQLISGNGIPLWSGPWHGPGMEQAMQSGLVTIGTPHSIGLNQIAIRDPDLVQPA